MPDVEDLMQEWPPQFEVALKEVHRVVTLVTDNILNPALDA